MWKGDGVQNFLWPNVLNVESLRELEGFRGETVDDIDGLRRVEVFLESVGPVGVGFELVLDFSGAIDELKGGREFRRKIELEGEGVPASSQRLVMLARLGQYRVLVVDEYVRVRGGVRSERLLNVGFTLARDLDNDILEFGGVTQVDFNKSAESVRSRVAGETLKNDVGHLRLDFNL